MPTMLYSYETGEYTPVPDEDVQRLVLGGSHSFEADRDVNIILPNGEPYKVSGAEAGKAMQHGATFESEGMALRREYKQEYGSGFGNALLAFGAGTARGATLGMTDAVLGRYFGEDATGPLETYRQEFGGLTLTGELVGAVGSAAFTGSSSLAGTAARLSPAGALSLAATKVGGGVAERLIAKSATDSLLRKSAQVGLSTAVAGGLEGAVYGAGMELSDYALLDKPKSAEQIRANIGTSALWGGALGGILGSGIVLGIGGTKAAIQKTVSMFESLSNTKLVEGFTDTASIFVAKMTGEPLEDVQRALKLGKKDQAGKFTADLADEAALAADSLADIRKERVAISLQKTRDKIAQKHRQEGADKVIAARERDVGAIEANVERERSRLSEALTQDELDTVIEDMRISGLIDDLDIDIEKLREASVPVKSAFIDDNIDAIQAHVAAQEVEIEHLAILNEKARNSRAAVRGEQLAGADELATLRATVGEARHRSRTDLVELRAEREAMLSSFKDEEIELGLRQLREQGMLTEDTLALEKMTRDQKRQFAVDNAELMFQKAESDIERAELYRIIQEKMVADRASKVRVDHGILEEKAKVAAATKGARTEMESLLADANGTFDDLAAQANAQLTGAHASTEDLTHFFQARGVDGGGGVKEGFFSQLLPKIEAGELHNTQNILIAVREKTKSLLNRVDVLAGSSDTFLGGGVSGEYSQLLQEFGRKVDAGIVMSLGKSMGREFTAAEIRGMPRNQLRQIVDDFLSGRGFASSAEANRAMFRHVDDLKRRLQEAVRRVKFNDAAPSVRAEGGLISIIKDIDASILKNTEFFGDEAVTMFSEMNGAISNYLSHRDAMVRPLMRRMAGTQRDRIADKGNMGTILRNIDLHGHSSVPNRTLLNNYLDSSEALERQFSRFYRVPPGGEPGLVLAAGAVPGRAGLKAGFPEAASAVRASVKSLRDTLETAKRNKESIKAFQMLFGRRIQLDEVGDDILTQLKGYTDKLDDLSAARSDLNDLISLRKTIGEDTYAGARAYSADTKALAAKLQMALKGDKLEEVNRLFRLAEDKAALQARGREIQARRLESELGRKALKESERIRLKGEETQIQKDLLDVDAALRKDELALQSRLRNAIEEERSAADVIAKEMDELRSVGKLRDAHKRYSDAARRGDRDKQLLEINRKITRNQAEKRANKASLNEYKKTRKHKRLHDSQKLKAREAELKAEGDRLKADKKALRQALKSAKHVEDVQVLEKESRLLIREMAAKETLAAHGAGKGAAGLAPSILAGAVSSIPFGIGGGMLTGLAVSMARPQTFARVTTGLWGVTEAAERAMAKGIDSMVDSLVSKATPKAGSRRANVLPAFLGSLSALAEAETPTERRDEYSNAAARLTTLANNEALLTQKLSESVKDVRDVDPELAEELQVQSANEIAFLNSHMPKPAQSMGAGIFSRSTPPSDMEIRSFIPLINMAEDPIGEFTASFVEGTTTDKQILMAQVCYPDMYASFCTGIVEGISEKIQDARSKGKEPPRIPYTRRLLCERVVGSGLEPTMGGEFLMAMANTRPPEPQKPTHGRNFNPLKKGAERETLPLQTAMAG